MYLFILHINLQIHVNKALVFWFCVYWNFLEAILSSLSEKKKPYFFVLPWRRQKAVGRSEKKS